jgi:hypothetical protein
MSMINPPLTTSARELNEHMSWFHDDARSAVDNAGPFVVVVDDFYENPEKIREMALAWEFKRYAPPSPELFSQEFIAQVPKISGTWFSTAVVCLRGTKAENPFYGQRHQPETLRKTLSDVVSNDILGTSWATAGDYWNGAFHLIDENFPGGKIHHHFREGDVAPRGWSGVVYLSPGAPSWSGTSIWRKKSSGLCVASQAISDESFDARLENYEMALNVENKFNRLVLFRENVLHRPEKAFGLGRDARMTQTFFFNTP